MKRLSAGMTETLKSPDELVQTLGNRLRALRLSTGMTQETLADKAGISPRALRDLEAGRGSTLHTLVRALKALDADEAIEALVPQPDISPMALLDKPKGRQRGYR